MLGVVHAAVFMGAIAGAQILLPLMVTDLAPTSRELSLGYVVGVAAVFGMMGSVLVGAFSDRTKLRFGRRRPWMLGLSVLSAASLVAAPHAENILALVLLWSVFIFAISGILTVARAVIPDQIPDERRGLASGLFNLGLPLGTLLGTVLVAVVLTDATAAFTTLATLNFVSVAAFVLLFTDPPASPAEPNAASVKIGDFVRGLWVSPGDHPAFAIFWGTRVLVLLGWQMGFSYMFFFLEDAVRYEDLFPDREVSYGVATLTAVVIFALFISSFLSGWISDRTGRRLPFVVASALLLGVSLFALAFARDWSVLLVVAAMLGLAIGTFIAVELALVTELLPSADDRGKDLGLVGVADSLPNALGPFLAGSIVALAGYPQMFLAAALTTTVGALLVTRIKGHK